MKDHIDYYNYDHHYVNEGDNGYSYENGMNSVAN